MKHNNLFKSNLIEPLDKEQINYYFKKMESGDKTARDIIITHNIKLVINEVLKKYDSTPFDEEELVSIGIVGLIKGVDSYKIGKNTSFSTYALKCINNEILMFLRKGKKYVNDISLEAPIIINNDDEEQKLIDLICDENSDFTLIYDNENVYSLIREMIGQLSEIEQIVVINYFGFVDDKMLNQRELGECLGFSRSYITRVLSKALKKISYALQDSNMIDPDQVYKSFRKKQY